MFQAVPTSKGQALADEYGIKFFETVKQTCLIKTYKTPLVICLLTVANESFHMSECQNKSKCGRGFLLDSKGH